MGHGFVFGKHSRPHLPHFAKCFLSGAAYRIGVHEGQSVVETGCRNVVEALTLTTSRVGESDMSSPRGVSVRTAKYLLLLSVL